MNVAALIVALTSFVGAVTAFVKVLRHTRNHP